MKIALDYDGTYTEDTPFWDDFIIKAQNRNHDVRIVTFRGPDTRIIHHFEIPVIYTDAWAKKEYCRQIVKWEPDIWIDDQPELIV